MDNDVSFQHLIFDTLGDYMTVSGVSFKHLQHFTLYVTTWQWCVISTFNIWHSTWLHDSDVSFQHLIFDTLRDYMDSDVSFQHLMFDTLGDYMIVMCHFNI